MKRFSSKALQITLIILLCGVGFWTWRNYRQPGDGDPPIPTDVISPMGTNGKRNWSKAVVHFPGYPVDEDDREWSHHEIAQRHKALVMKDLPEYVTDLRGGGRLKETKGTSAAWYFVVPKERMTDFEQYLLDLGVPVEAMRNTWDPDWGVEGSAWEAPPPEVPATKLLMGSSMKAEGEGEIRNMPFGKSSETIDYHLKNPNLSRALIRIRVGWKSGNVQFCEVPVNPDWEK